MLTADLFDHQNIIDRRPALRCVAELRAGMRAPRAEDAALPEAKLSRPAADALVRRLSRADVLTLFVRDNFDLGALSAEPFASLLETARARGATARLALRRATFAACNAAQRLGLRDAGARHDLGLALADPPTASHDSALLATLETSAGTTAWFTRDHAATVIGVGWGVGQDKPVVYGLIADPVTVDAIDPSTLLPKPTTAILVIQEDAGRALDEFGPWFAQQLRSKLEPLSLWRPGALTSLSYSDRYLRSPLTVTLALRACAGLRDILALRGVRIPLRLASVPLSGNNPKVPFHLHDDWQRTEDRNGVAVRLADIFGLIASIAEGAPHWRELRLTYSDGAAARLFLDRGFGYWQSKRERYDFAVSTERQAQRLRDFRTRITGTGPTYIVMAAETN